MSTPRPPDGGDGWVECACGRRHWGRLGAAGLMLVAGGEVLLQHRALWSHDGGTWGLPGGARHPGETALQGALREAGEETGVSAGAVRPVAELAVDHGTWSYTTVLAHAPPDPRARPPAVALDGESIEVRWVPLAGVGALPMHPGLAASWPRLVAAAGSRVTVVVDAANVVGSRPDGWWRDRVGAAARLRDEVAALLRAPLPAPELPLELPPLTAWYAEPVLVVEGAARALPEDGGGVPVVRARGPGDDAVVAAVRSALDGGSAVLAVTADRELAGRVRAAGGAVAGPRWLRERLAR